MKTYKNIDEFIIEAFPQEHELFIKLEKSDLESDVEKLDATFSKELEEALKEKKAEQKEETVKGKKTEQKADTVKGKKTEPKGVKAPTTNNA